MESPQKMLKDLGDDIMMDIFDCLDKSSLEQASRVCLRWHNLIINSTHLTNRLTLHIQLPLSSHNLLGIIEYFHQKSLEFPYRSFSVEARDKKDSKLWNLAADKFLNIFKDPLRLHLKTVPILTSTRLIKHSASTLTHLKIENGISGRPEQFGVADIDLDFPNLLCLDLFQNRVPGSITAPKLREFYFRCSPSFRNYRNSFQDPLGSFLKKLPNLKKLSTMMIPDLELEDIKFQLEELDLGFSCEMDEEVTKKFLISQQRSLKKIKFHESSTYNYQNFLDLVVKHTAITVLDISGPYKDTANVNNILHTNHTIKDLTISISPVEEPFYDIPDVEHVLEVVKKCRGVENLRLMAMSGLDDFLIRVDFCNLKRLALNFAASNDLSSLNFQHMQFEKLEVLKISDLTCKTQAEMLLKITSCCPNLKRLNLGSLKYLKGLDHLRALHLTSLRNEAKARRKSEEILNKKFLLSLFKYSPNVEELVIIDCPYLLDEFLFSIKSCKSNLKLLRVGVSENQKLAEMRSKLTSANFIVDIYDKNDNTKLSQFEWHETIDWQSCFFANFKREASEW